MFTRCLAAGSCIAHRVGSVGSVSHSKGCKGTRGGGDLPEERMQAGQHQALAAPSHAERRQAVH